MDMSTITYMSSRNIGSAKAFKFEWWRYCDTFGENVRDPGTADTNRRMNSGAKSAAAGRHHARFIEIFLAHYMNGTIISLYASSLEAQSFSFKGFHAMGREMWQDMSAG